MGFKALIYAIAAPFWVLGRWLRHHVLGFYPDETRQGSNVRRFVGRVTLVMSFVFLPLMFWLVAGDDVWLVRSVWLAAAWSLVFFGGSVLLLGFFVTEPKATRLFLDTGLSAIAMIIVFGCLFAIYQIVPPEDAQTRWYDPWYFAIVTFSTLGFGDFRPHADSRMIAAGLAILGNLHLAVLVGAVFRSMK